MGELTLELAGSWDHGPDGHSSHTLAGYIHRGDKTVAVYYVGWPLDGVERRSFFFLSIGRWGDGTDGTMRRAVGLECRVGEDGPVFMVINADELPWAAEKDFLGQPLRRDEVIGTPLAQKVFEMIDLILEEDPRVEQHLEL